MSHIRQTCLVLGGLLLGLSLSAQIDSTYIRKAQEIYDLYTQWESAAFGLVPNADGIIMRDSVAAEALLTRVRESYDRLGKKDREGVKKQILADVVTSFDEKANVDFIADAERALTILPPNDPSGFDILCILADVYIGHEQKEALGETLDRMDQYSASMTSENASIMAEYEAAFESMPPFEESLTGYWLTSSWSNQEFHRYQPWLILSISPQPSMGMQANILKESSISTRAMNKNGGLFRKSGEFMADPQKGTFLFNFFTNKYRYGNATVAHGLVDSAAETRAQFHAMAKDDRLTIGESVQTELAGAAMASIFELIAQEISVSKIKEDYIYMTGGKESGDVLSANFFYQKQVIRSDTMYPTKQTLYNSNVMFWRWKQEDGIVFGRWDCSPVSPYVKTLTKDMELYSIRRDTRFNQKKYILPIGISFAGAALWYAIGDIAGIKPLKKVAGLQMALSVVVPIALFVNDRDKAVQNYNKLQYDRLYEIYSPNAE